MPGPLYNYVKDSLRINIQQDAEEIIQEASSAESWPFSSSKFNSSKFQDMMSSLLLLRSHDINMTNRNLLYFADGIMPPDRVRKLQQETSGEGITKSDILFSMTTMPCRCPIVLECCTNISTKGEDINYLVVFQQDKDFLHKQRVHSIEDLARFSRERHSNDELEDMWRKMMANTQYRSGQPRSSKANPTRQPYPERHIYNLASLTRDKMRIWDIGSNEVAIPLANMLSP
jgi:hypothetical protein